MSYSQVSYIGRETKRDYASSSNSLSPKTSAHNSVLSLKNDNSIEGIIHNSEALSLATSAAIESKEKKTKNNRLETFNEDEDGDADIFNASCTSPLSPGAVHAPISMQKLVIGGLQAVSAACSSLSQSQASSQLLNSVYSFEVPAHTVSLIQLINMPSSPSSNDIKWVGGTEVPGVLIVDDSTGDAKVFHPAGDLLYRYQQLVPAEEKIKLCPMPSSIDLLKASIKKCMKKKNRGVNKVHFLDKGHKTVLYSEGSCRGSNQDGIIMQTHFLPLADGQMLKGSMKKSLTTPKIIYKGTRVDHLLFNDNQKDQEGDPPSTLIVITSERGYVRNVKSLANSLSVLLFLLVFALVGLRTAGLIGVLSRVFIDTILGKTSTVHVSEIQSMQHNKKGLDKENESMGRTVSAVTTMDVAPFRSFSGYTFIGEIRKKDFSDKPDLSQSSLILLRQDNHDWSLLNKPLFIVYDPYKDKIIHKYATWNELPISIKSLIDNRHQLSILSQKLILSYTHERYGEKPTCCSDNQRNLEIVDKKIMVKHEFPVSPHENFGKTLPELLDNVNNNNCHWHIHNNPEIMQCGASYLMEQRRGDWVMRIEKIKAKISHEEGEEGQEKEDRFRIIVKRAKSSKQ